ncbi:DegT/DnrJ/EryC1/StrS family aminotransferase [Tahibacter sp.]|uniref:DegT/DnrJ/EryC1/StrS family aminotransferase n=1 Tax=Tahibacter sp. TaxID=2056211 RepID=UPI0028C44BF4|nr:DegT/DnrJ/EryC1/StrS family aminotransferase [Tahibacter sp.]
MNSVTATEEVVPLNDLRRHADALAEPIHAATMRVIRSGWFVLGPELEAFEREFAAYCGANHGVGVANGTEAIELALRAFDIGPGDEVVVAANAGMYSTTALLAIGSTPIYADVREHDLTLDPEAVRHAISPRTRAIIATHLYGRLADVVALRAIADSHGLAFIEDCAQAHGCSRDGVRAGAWGDAATFSFYPTKNLGACGDAGLVTCRSADTAARLRRLRQYGWGDKYVVVDGPARNSRLDEMQAAILREKLPHLEGWNARRRKIAAMYAAVETTALRYPDVSGADYVAHLFVVRTSHRDALRRHLSARRIASDVHYPVLDNEQPRVDRRDLSAGLPQSVRAAAEILTLPCFPEMTDAEVGRVCDALREWRS